MNRSVDYTATKAPVEEEGEEEEGEEGSQNEVHGRKRMN
jgi:hypothetical protein